MTNKITKLMLRIDVKNEMAVHFDDGQIFAYIIANGAYIIPGPSYADDGGFSRFRMRDDGGTVYFEAGHSGVFQPLGSRLNPFGAIPLRDMKVHLQSFTLSNVDAGGDAVYDNLNVP